MSHLETADSILGELGAVNAEIAPIRQEMADIIAAAQEEYGPQLQPLEDRRKDLEKRLRKLMKTRDAEIFEGSDLVVLKHGRLVKHWDNAVKRGGKWAKDVLFALKSLGWDRLIKRTEAPDWDQVDKLDNNQLAQLGAERKTEWKYSFELKK